MIVITCGQFQSYLADHWGTLPLVSRCDDLNALTSLKQNCKMNWTILSKKPARCLLQYRKKEITNFLTDW